MRRADRLFELIQLIRQRKVATASWLARELGVSERTVYRDVRDLVRSGVPIEGEAGVGYALPRGFDLPPLMFTRDEIEALVLGARIVRSWSDPALSKAATSALSKVEAVVPERLKTRVADALLFAPGFHVPAVIAAHFGPLRRALDQTRRVRFGYTRGDGTASARTVRPLGLYFWGPGWSLAGWCELRNDFRNFRLDRMRDVTVQDAFDVEPGKRLEDYMAAMEREGAERD
ncbi:MAG: YafY family transcriptional regulator [Deltaproteobacteria bacterium]|nr:YafY family transcriptional regulator [Deltaproteobacteria bacterium]